MPRSARHLQSHLVRDSASLAAVEGAPLDAQFAHLGVVVVDDPTLLEPVAGP